MNFKPKRRCDLKIEKIEEDYFLYDPLSDSFFLLNETAKIVFEMCDGHFTLYEMVELISDTLNVKKEKILRDVKRTLNEFIEKGIVEKNRD